MLIYYLIFNIGLFAIVSWGSNDVKRFLSTYSTIDSEHALETFKSLARRNMIATLIYLPVGLSSLLWSIYLVIKFDLVGLMVVLAVQVPLALLSLNLKRLEDRARGLESLDATLGEEHLRVSKSWIKKALPDF